MIVRDLLLFILVGYLILVIVGFIKHKIGILVGALSTFIGIILLIFFFRDLDDGFTSGLYDISPFIPIEGAAAIFFIIGFIITGLGIVLTVISYIRLKKKYE